MKIYYLMNYVALSTDRIHGYTPTADEVSARKEVWNFKDGCCSQHIMVGLASGIAKLADSNTVVCFVPASTGVKTSRRFGRIAPRLATLSGIPCTLEGIRRTEDGEAGHISGKTADPASVFAFNPEVFRGKRVILIDDVVTRGNTLSSTARRLLSGGAEEVVGLVVARTYNPFWSGGENRNLEKLLF